MSQTPLETPSFPRVDEAVHTSPQASQIEHRQTHAQTRLEALIRAEEGREGVLTAMFGPFKRNIGLDIAPLSSTSSKSVVARPDDSDRAMPAVIIQGLTRRPRTCAPTMHTDPRLQPHPPTPHPVSRGQVGSLGSREAQSAAPWHSKSAPAVEGARGLEHIRQHGHLQQRRSSCSPSPC